MATPNKTQEALSSASSCHRSCPWVTARIRILAQRQVVSFGRKGLNIAGFVDYARLTRDFS